MSTKREITTRGVVVARAGLGEGSVRVFVYTEENGLIGALAKSAREERSKLRPHLQVGTFGRYTLVRGAYEWRMIGAFDTQSTYFLLADKKSAQQASARLFSVVRQLVRGEEKNSELLDVLWEFLNTLKMLSDEEVRIAERLALVRILASLGYVAPRRDVPHLEGNMFDGATLRALHPFEGRLMKTINDALLASGLV